MFVRTYDYVFGVTEDLFIIQFWLLSSGTFSASVFWISLQNFLDQYDYFRQGACIL